MLIITERGPPLCNPRALWWTLPQTCSSGFADEKAFVRLCRSHLSYPHSREAGSKAVHFQEDWKASVEEKQIWKKSRFLLHAINFISICLKTLSQIPPKWARSFWTQLSPIYLYFSLWYLTLNPVRIPLSFTNYWFFRSCLATPSLPVFAWEPLCYIMFGGFFFPFCLVNIDQLHVSGCTFYCCGLYISRGISFFVGLAAAT